MPKADSPITHHNPLVKSVAIVKASTKPKITNARPTKHPRIERLIFLLDLYLGVDFAVKYAVAPKPATISQRL